MAFIPSRIKRHNTEDPTKVGLNLTSMMDMFTIILVFLMEKLQHRRVADAPFERFDLAKVDHRNDRLKWRWM